MPSPAVGDVVPSPNRPHAGLPLALLVGLAVVLAATGVVLPQRNASGDTASHALTAWSLLSGRWGFVTPEDLQRGGWPSPPRVYFLETQDGRWVTGYGVGVALLLLPLYAVLAAVGAPPQVILSQLVSQGVACAFAIAALWLTAGVVARLAGRRAAAWAAVVMALGSPMLSLLAREVWQQSVLTALYGGAAWLLLRPAGTLTRAALVGGGALVGFAAAVRPTAVVYAVLWGWAVGRLAGRRAAWFAAPVVLGVGAVACYQALVFGQPFLAGQALIPLAKFGPAGVMASNPLAALAGVLFSPGVGWFLFSPAFLAVAAMVWPAAWRAAGEGCPVRRVARDLVLVAVLFNLITSASYREWWGGWGYGPRYLADTLVFWVLALGLVLGAAERRSWAAKRWLKAVWVAVVLLSGAQHAAGLLVDPYGEGSYNWCYDIDRHPEVLWQRSPALHNVQVFLKNGPGGGVDGELGGP